MTGLDGLEAPPTAIATSVLALRGACDTRTEVKQLQQCHLTYTTVRKTVHLVVVVGALGVTVDRSVIETLF